MLVIHTKRPLSLTELGSLCPDMVPVWSVWLLIMLHLWPAHAGNSFAVTAQEKYITTVELRLAVGLFAARLLTVLIPACAGRMAMTKYGALHYAVSDLACIMQPLASRTAFAAA